MENKVILFYKNAYVEKQPTRRARGEESNITNWFRSGHEINCEAFMHAIGLVPQVLALVSGVGGLFHTGKST